MHLNLQKGPNDKKTKRLGNSWCS